MSLAWEKERIQIYFGWDNYESNLSDIPVLTNKEPLVRMFSKNPGELGNSEKFWRIGDRLTQKNSGELSLVSFRSHHPVLHMDCSAKSLSLCTIIYTCIMLTLHTLRFNLVFVVVKIYL